MRVCKKMVIYLGIKRKYTWQKNARISCSRDDCKYTWEKTARISCHNFETNGRPYLTDISFEFTFLSLKLWENRCNKLQCRSKAYSDLFFVLKGLSFSGTSLWYWAATFSLDREKIFLFRYSIFFLAIFWKNFNSLTSFSQFWHTYLKELLNINCDWNISIKELFVVCGKYLVFWCHSNLQDVLKRLKYL